MKKIIFDLDNTLLFVTDEWVNYYQEYINKYNLRITPQELYDTIGRMEYEFCGKIITKEVLANYLRNNLLINIDIAKIDDFLDMYASIPIKDTEEVKDVLEYLYRSYEILVYSNWFSLNQAERIRRQNMQKYFTKIYGWDDVPVKPSVEGIKQIVGNDIDSYTVIGDSIKFDLEVPASLGIDTILYNRNGIEQDTYKEVKEIEELKHIL